MLQPETVAVTSAEGSQPGEDVDQVMAAIVGAAGLRPTLAAIRRGAVVALAAGAASGALAFVAGFWHAARPASNARDSAVTVGEGDCMARIQIGPTGVIWANVPRPCPRPTARRACTG